MADLPAILQNSQRRLKMMAEFEGALQNQEENPKMMADSQHLLQRQAPALLMMATQQQKQSKLQEIFFIQNKTTRKKTGKIRQKQVIDFPINTY